VQSGSAGGRSSSRSCFIAVSAILFGTLLGLAVGYNVIRDSQKSPSWENLGFDVPWVNLAIIFLVVFAVAVATTWAPSTRASRVYPAEALRYE
jgi:putative ABC transport system permease protein